MVLFHGYNTNIRYIAETSYGSGGSIGTAIGGKVINFSPSINNNLQRTQGLGEGRNQTQNIYGAFDCSGTIEWEMSDFTFLQFAVGPITGAGSTASHYVLTEANLFDYSTPDLETFKMEVTSEEGAADDSDVYTGCHITEFSISANEGEKIKCSANWVAQKPTSSTSGTAAYSPDTQDVWTFWQGTLKYNSTPDAVVKVTSFSVTMNNNSQVYRSLGSRFINQPELGVRTYDFTITVKMSDTIATEFRDDMYGQANSPIDGAAVSEYVDGQKLELLLSEGSAGGDRNATIFLLNAAVNEISKPVSLGEGIVEVTINGYAKSAGNSNKLLDWFTTT